MQGLVSVWGVLTPVKRLALIAAVGATVVVFSLLAQSASKPPMSLLYAGLDSRTAGAVITALDGMDVPFEIRGEAIYVASSKRDSARMSLAAKGLPDQGQAGYELLDKLNGFSTTSDMFDATYWRAKEGELARTILATPGVRAARVHIANPRGGPFSRNAQAPTAVVTVTTGASRLDDPQAQAIRYLVASAVANLPADRVAVIDSEYGVILSPGEQDASMREQNNAVDRESRMEKDILNLLEARVGPGNARVQVALELDTEHETVSERTFNPDGRMVSGKETTEISEKTTGGSSGAVTVASNLPEGDAPGGDSSRTERTETKESIKYDMSEVRREREKLPGAVRRLSIAVFVNQIAEEGEEGGEPVMRSAEELEMLKKLVADAAGLDEKRGDAITVEALPFITQTNDGVLVESNPVGEFLQAHLMSAIQIAFLSIVSIILGLFVVKPLLSTKGAPPMAPAAAPQQLHANNAPAAGALPQPGAPPQAQDSIASLKSITATKSDEAANLIKSWLETAEDAA